MVEKRFEVKETSLIDILNNQNYAMTYKNEIIAYALMIGNISATEVEPYLKEMSVTNGNTTDYRRLLCAFDYVMYSD